jgi:lipopolysaccharide transport system permease protein
MNAYLTAVWRCRYFWLSLVRMDLRTRYRRSILGVGWSLLHPLMMAAVLCFVFHRMANLNIWVYGPQVLAALAFWNFFNSCALQGCQCLFQGESYIRQYPTPLAIFPLRVTLGTAIHFTIALLVAMALCVYVHLSGRVTGEKGEPLPYHWLAWLTLVPTLVLIVLFCWSVSVITSFSNVHFPDTQHLCEVGMQILFYASPVLYTPAMVGDSRFARFFNYHPLAAMIQLIRDPVVDGRIPGFFPYLIAGIATALVFGTACLALARLKRRLIFHL